MFMVYRNIYLIGMQLNNKRYLCPPQWVGLKFFNVYGPNEYHKGSMQSVVKHSLDQYNKTGIVKLFKSYNDKFKKWTTN